MGLSCSGVRRNRWVGQVKRGSEEISNLMDHTMVDIG